MTASQCDAQHLRFRSEGGQTAIENMALLCPTHHRRLHNMGAHVWMSDTASDWYIAQDHTDRIIDQWSNPPPRIPPDRQQPDRPQPDRHKLAQYHRPEEPAESRGPDAPRLQPRQLFAT